MSSCTFNILCTDGRNIPSFCIWRGIMLCVCVHQTSLPRHRQLLWINQIDELLALLKKRLSSKYRKWKEMKGVKAPLIASSRLLTNPPPVKAWWSKPQLTCLHVCPWVPGQSYKLSGRTWMAGKHLSMGLTLLSFSVQWGETPKRLFFLTIFIP